ncbi:hypothetical protein LOZ53_002089 [Ophidiomyces ophidiicola]|uniref:uncharacterized protein n=1 Tax=Ophidiomyces ophidiicola TaxID=1387563 RepID=UPI0020C2A243|nr:uncharacterized protein LOZ57_003204 [Ophidiomyces ophidiicola]KAI1914205.1 hypothetical protein LOZ61_002383 [Ophidiomyces ophidiicola]KAI1918809.1 hypothetical protein LOZ64_002569 [Ophidiomyces ophidiicola]KAI1926226.1 hypothetical protein LOZ60_003702 [Ophidiomyces ophidiicola]KAI1947475.1 hypothetical protein LOZ57_003204 [Ophidiomyces ophidiicola]KAI1977244.1 hypothetical protein LOZ55_003627 [Ophidiomyces ophidiicola]
MAHQDPSKRYTLQVTAGPAYDTKTHRIVPVNADETLTIETEYSLIKLCVRIQDFCGLPPSAPRTCEYFSHPDHKYDQYSISIAFLPKRTIPGSELVFGNDFDHPIRDRLPPGTNYALKLVKWIIDPGLEGDPYGDLPYLYGAALSSWNYFRICEREGVVSRSGSSTAGSILIDEKEGDSRSHSCAGSKASSVSVVELHDEVVQEGGEGTGREIRDNLNIPDDASSRKKYFLDEKRRHAFEFEAGRLYKADFGNPYLGFSDFSLRLPGFSINIAKYIDKKNHQLRYVLKNKNSGDIYFVVLFTLLLNDFEGVEDGERESEEQQIEESEVD